MKNLKKKVVALGASLAVAVSALTMSVSAATAYPWGPNYFTPYTGRFAASNRHISAHNMEWTADQIQHFKDLQSLPGPWMDSTEYEFRPVGYGTHDIWKNAGTHSSNLPSAYYEFQLWDDDDVAVGCGCVAGCVAGTEYYGTLFFTPQDNAPTSAQYIFESEYGQTLGVLDAIPTAYEQYDLKDTYFGKSYSW